MALLSIEPFTIKLFVCISLFGPVLSSMSPVTLFREALETDLEDNNIRSQIDQFYTMSRNFARNSITARVIEEGKSYVEANFAQGAYSYPTRELFESDIKEEISDFLKWCTSGSFSTYMRSFEDLLSDLHSREVDQFRLIGILSSLFDNEMSKLSEPRELLYTFRCQLARSLTNRVRSLSSTRSSSEVFIPNFQTGEGDDHHQVNAFLNRVGTMYNLIDEIIETISIDSEGVEPSTTPRRKNIVDYDIENNQNFIESVLGYLDYDLSREDFKFEISKAALEIQEYQKLLNPFIEARLAILLDQYSAERCRVDGGLV